MKQTKNYKEKISLNYLRKKTEILLFCFYCLGVGDLAMYAFDIIGFWTAFFSMIFLFSVLICLVNPPGKIL